MESLSFPKRLLKLGFFIMITSNIKNAEERVSSISRGLQHGLLLFAPTFSAAPHLEKKKTRDAVCEFTMNKISSIELPPIGLCHAAVSVCIDGIKAILDCEAVQTFGWVEDIAAGSYWKMDPDELCFGLSHGWVGIAEFHSWITLDSGEIIDPSVFLTLAALRPKKFRRCANRCNTISPTGRPYQTVQGVPIIKYHPSVFTDCLNATSAADGFEMLKAALCVQSFCGESN